MSKKISILIANYNNGKYFHECWDSLLEQTDSDWEAIIVDDCSTDNSLDLIKTIIAGDKRAKLYVNDQNRGCGYTKKRCADLATGLLLAFLDPDDALESNAIDKMCRVFSENKNIVLAYSKHTRCNENMISVHREYDLKNIDTTDPYFFNFGAVISHFTVLKASAYKQTVGIDPYMLRAVDQDLYFKICEQGSTLAVNEYLYKYRIHQKGISTGIGNQTVTKAEYWHWYAINAAAKRRGIYVEDLFGEYFINKGFYNAIVKDNQMILNSGSYKLSQKLSDLKKMISKKK